MLSAILALVVASGASFALSREASAEPLPKAGVAAPFGISISQQNGSSYRELFPEFLFRQLSAGLEIDAIQGLNYRFRRDDIFENGSVTPLPLSVLSSGVLDRPLPRQRGFPFGRDSSLAKDTPEVGLAVAWNSFAAWSADPLWSFEIRQHQVSTLRPERVLEYRVQRLFPRSLPGESQQAVTMKELLAARVPTALLGYHWLTLRTFGADDDLVWVASPATRELRQLTGANRVDGIAASQVALDDLFGWSGKIEGVEARVRGRPTYLVPFASPDTARVVQSPGNCVAPEVNSAGVMLNATSHLFRDAAAWVPTSIVFAPRELLHVEYSSRDPYRAVGREEVYFDRESMLPVYREAFDRRGARLKSSFTAFGFAVSADGAKKLPYPAVTLVFPSDGAAVEVIEYRSTEVCPDYSTTIQAETFDPTALRKRIAPTPTPAPATPNATYDTTSAEPVVE